MKIKCFIVVSCLVLFSSAAYAKGQDLNQGDKHQLTRLCINNSEDTESCEELIKINKTQACKLLRDKNGTQGEYQKTLDTFCQTGTGNGKSNDTPPIVIDSRSNQTGGEDVTSDQKTKTEHPEKGVPLEPPVEKNSPPTATKLKPQTDFSDCKDDVLTHIGQWQKCALLFTENKKERCNEIDKRSDSRYFLAKREFCASPTPVEVSPGTLHLYPLNSSNMWMRYKGEKGAPECVIRLKTATKSIGKCNGWLGKVGSKLKPPASLAVEYYYSPSFDKDSTGDVSTAEIKTKYFLLKGAQWEVVKLKNQANAPVAVTANQARLLSGKPVLTFNAKPTLYEKSALYGLVPKGTDTVVFEFKDQNKRDIFDLLQRNSDSSKPWQKISLFSEATGKPDQYLLTYKYGWKKASAEENSLRGLIKKKMAMGTGFGKIKETTLLPISKKEIAEIERLLYINDLMTSIKKEFKLDDIEYKSVKSVIQKSQFSFKNLEQNLQNNMWKTIKDIVIRSESSEKSRLKSYQEGEWSALAGNGKGQQEKRWENCWNSFIGQETKKEIQDKRKDSERWLVHRPIGNAENLYLYNRAKERWDRWSSRLPKEKEFWIKKDYIDVTKDKNIYAWARFSRSSQNLSRYTVTYNHSVYAEPKEIAYRLVKLSGHIANKPIYVFPEGKQALKFDPQGGKPILPIPESILASSFVVVQYDNRGKPSRFFAYKKGAGTSSAPQNISLATISPRTSQDLEKKRKRDPKKTLKCKSKVVNYLGDQSKTYPVADLNWGPIRKGSALFSANFPWSTRLHWKKEAVSVRYWAAADSFPKEISCPDLKNHGLLLILDATYKSTKKVTPYLFALKERAIDSLIDIFKGKPQNNFLRTVHVSTVTDITKDFITTKPKEGSISDLRGAKDLVLTKINSPQFEIVEGIVSALSKKSSPLAGDEKHFVYIGGRVAGDSNIMLREVKSILDKMEKKLGIPKYNMRIYAIGLSNRFVSRGDSSLGIPIRTFSGIASDDDCLQADTNRNTDEYRDIEASCDEYEKLTSDFRFFETVDSNLRPNRGK